MSLSGHHLRSRHPVISSRETHPRTRPNATTCQGGNSSRTEPAGWPHPSRLAEDQVQRPAAAHVRAVAAAMLDEFLVVASGVEQGVGQDGEAVEGALLVDAFGDAAHRAVIPSQDGGSESADRAERKW